MLNEKEIELFEYMDYQVVNNGMDGWLGNRCFDRLDEFVSVLYKRNTPLDRQAASLFIRTTTAQLGRMQLEPVKFIPDVKETIRAYEQEIENCYEEYLQIAKSLMESYGLKDFGTIIEEKY